MFPSKQKQYYRIISVLELEWEPRCEQALPRPFHALSFRIKGNAVFKHGNDTKTVEAGEVAFVPKGYSYTLDEAIDAHLFVIHFDQLPDKAYNFESFKVTNPAWYEEHFRRLYRLWQRKEKGYRLDAASIFYRILSELVKEGQNSQHSVEDKLAIVLEYIHSNYTDTALSVDRLAKMYGASATYFRRIFKERYGSLPLTYINALRLKRAEELIRSGYYSISQAAALSGFSDPKYFSRFVKKTKGDSPSRLWKI